VPHNAKISKSTGKPSYDMGLYQFVFSDAVAVITCKLQNEKRIKIVGWHNYFKRPSKYDGGTSERLSEMVEQFDSLIETASTLGCLDWRTTISGIAHSVYRANMPDIPIYSHNSPDTKQLERQAFFGGRVSAFGTGRISEQVHYIDCVSMYPAIMGSTPLPSRILSHFRNLDCSPDRIKGNPESMIARCLISSNSTEYPTREKDSLEYSIGELETVLCGPEFKHAIDSGHVIKVMEIAEYKLDVLFADFVDKCWNARIGYREQGNKAMEHSVKLIMNSLQGKFGQRAGELEYRPDIIPPCRWGIYRHAILDTGEIRDYRVAAGNAFQVCERSEVSGSITSIPAFIASAGRIIMDKVRIAAGKNNVFYQGVDAVIVNQQGLDNLAASEIALGDDIGQFRVSKSADSAIIYGKSHYRIGNQLIQAGASPSVKRISDTVFVDQRQPSLKTSAFTGPMPHYTESSYPVFVETEHCQVANRDFEFHPSKVSSFVEATSLVSR
jgi:hypothetical protein